MKKTTRKFISSILAAAMLITSTVAMPVSTYAVDYGEGATALVGLAKTVEETGNVKTTTWTFDTSAGTTESISAGDTLEGILVTGSGKKSWKGTNQFAVSNKMGFSLPISSGCTDGTVVITGISNDDTRYLYLVTDEAVTVPYIKGESTISFSSSNVVDGYLEFSNTKSSGDYKMSQIVLIENISASAGDDNTSGSAIESSTEAPTEATTEAPTEATTEAPTEATTEAPTEATTDAATEATTDAATEATTDAATEATTQAPVVSGPYSYVASNVGTSYAAGATVYEDANGTIVAAQPLNVNAISDTGVVINGNSYDVAQLVSTGTNTALTVTGGPSGNYRVGFSVTAKNDITVKVDLKVGAGKAAYLTASAVTAGSTCEPIDGLQPQVDTFTTLTADVKAGETIYFIGYGTNAPIYGIDIAAAGGSSSEDTTTEATTETATEASTEAPTTIDPDSETTTAVVGVDTVNVAASLDGVASVNGVQTLASDAVGTQVKVNIDLSGVEGTAGINNYTFFIKYNPAVIKAVSVAEATDLTGYATANGAVAYDAASIQTNSIDYVPSAANPDFADVAPDGVKSAAELGKVKLADNLGNGVAIANSGTLVALNFEVVAAGSSDLEIVLVENGFFSEPGAAKDVTAVATTNSVVVEAAETSTETSTEASTEASTESSTEASTEASTETTTESTTVAPPATGTINVSISPDGKISVDKLGDTVTFNIDTAIGENAGYNNYTFYIDFDPAVVRPVLAVAPESPVKTADGTSAAADVEAINAAIGYVPSASNSDFAGLGADGVKTAAELGRIKIADYAGTDSQLDLVTISGTLASIQFEVIAEGNTGIKLVLFENGFFTAPDSTDTLTVNLIDNTSSVEVTEDVPVYGPVADVNMDGVVGPQDCTDIVQNNLTPAYILECMKAYPDTYMYIADVNDDGVIGPGDAAYILQYCLDKSFRLPIMDKRGE